MLIRTLVCALLCAAVLTPAALADDAPAAGAPTATAEAAPPPAPAPTLPTTRPAEERAADPTVPRREEPVAAEVVGWLEIVGPIPDMAPPLAWVDPEAGTPSLRRLVQQIRRVEKEPRFQGMVIRLDEADLSMTQVDELVDAIAAMRAADKKVLIFAESYDLPTYLLASACDEIVLRHKGQLELAGIGIEELYVTGLLEKIGVKADFMQVGRFKGADEPLTRTGPSPAWNENIDAVLDDLYKQIIARIGMSRRLTPAEVEKAFADSWAMNDAQYLERRLIDRLSDPELTDATEAAFGADFEWVDLLASDRPPAEVDNPFALLRTLLQPPRPRARRPSIAVINASGPIMGGEGAGGLFGGEAIGSRTLSEAIDQAIEDRQIKGVVLRLDSPGGSPLASEVIWQAVRELRESKPVYVSIGGMAASGGYYIASAADRIYVSPTSVVGSIGVVGGKLVLGGLYDKLGIAVHRRSRGPLGDMFNSVEPFTEQQRDSLHQAFEHTYKQFVERVAIGRGQRVRDVAAVAEGKIFTGRQAVANGLADRAGGIEVAIADLAEQAGLAEGRYDVMTLPPPMSLPEFLERTLGGLSAPQPATALGADPALAAVRAALGRQRWEAARSLLNGVMLLQREPVLMLMPSAVVVR